jgi:hypothetical protein
VRGARGQTSGYLGCHVPAGHAGWGAS